MRAPTESERDLAYVDSLAAGADDGEDAGLCRVDHCGGEAAAQEVGDLG